jgi:ribosome biogenesis protein Nip4
MELSDFDEIRRIVMEDSSLMRALTSAETEAELFALVIALGGERGFELTVAQLEEIARANRRAWFERWLTQ